MNSEWSFPDPGNVAVFTTSDIVSGKAPILRVTHDKEDGAWQFHSGTDAKVSDAKMIALEEIVRIDPSLCQLADLPLGEIAVRDDPTKPWRRSTFF